MRGKSPIASLISDFLSLFFLLLLVDCSRSMNSSQNSETDKNSSEQSTSRTLAATQSSSSQAVETSTTLPAAVQTSTTLESTTTLSNKHFHLKARISLKLDAKEKITRGESFLLKVNVTNEGDADAKNVKVTVELPNGFSTDEREKVCGVIEVNSTCELEFSVKSDLSTQLGENEIKVRVSYE
jgi:uncharacterized repeat protein (TIGR01451 family)